MNGFHIVVLAAGLIAPGASPSEPSVQLVAFDDLQRRFGEPHLRLLDARPQGEYDKGHIPGAVRVDAKAVEKMAAKPGALTDRAAWEAWIAPLGIGPDTECWSTTPIISSTPPGSGGCFAILESGRSA